MLDIKALLTKMLNAIKVDYIIEQGTNNSWTYRKWNSGIYEAWRTSTNSFNMSTKYGTDQYYTTDYYTIPSNVLSINHIDLKRIGGGNGLVETSIYDVNITNQRVSFYIWNDGASYSGSFTMGMRLIGKWK